MEVELKYRIDGQRSFQKLLAALPPAESSFVQTNNYLDDAARSLRKAPIMLRAREVRLPAGALSSLAPSVTFEAKRRISKEDGLFISEERAQVMSLDEWMAIKVRGLPIPTDGPLFRWLAGVAPHGGLAIIGKTTNHRHQIRSDLFVLELDCTQFPDGSEEFEVECETHLPDAGRAHIEDLFGRIGVEGHPQTKGKYARFLKKAGL